jgi:hypothetical protein
VALHWISYDKGCVSVLDQFVAKLNFSLYALVWIFDLSEGTFLQGCVNQRTERE